MTAAPAFAGLLPQITEHLGPVQWVEEATAHGPNRGFAVLYLNAPGNEIGSAVTNGLRFQNIKVVFPLELCCSLLAGLVVAAHKIVIQVAGMVLDGGVGVVSGTIIPGDRPLAEGTEMTGVICAEHPFVDAEFDTVRDADGKTEMQIITLIPASAAELTFATVQGTDALFDVWEQQETDLADITRPPARLPASSGPRANDGSPDRVAPGRDSPHEQAMPRSSGADDSAPPTMEPR